VRVSSHRDKGSGVDIREDYITLVKSCIIHMFLEKKIDDGLLNSGVNQDIVFNYQFILSYSL